MCPGDDVFCRWLASEVKVKLVEELHSNHFFLFVLLTIVLWSKLFLFLCFKMFLLLSLKMMKRPLSSYKAALREFQVERMSRCRELTSVSFWVLCCLG